MDPAELRCPDTFGHLLGKLHPGGVIELACYDCAAAARRAGRTVARVLHRFDGTGAHVGTDVLSEAFVTAAPPGGREPTNT